MTHPPHLDLLECGAAGAALERESGDVHVLAPFPGGALVAVIDGLGHGVEAATAAQEAAGVLQQFAGDAVTLLIERCHDALRKTRGAVMSLASFDADRATMTWAGVGNVEAVLLRASPEAPRESVSLRGGVVGYQLPPLRASAVPVSPGDTLVMVTDGIRSAFIVDLPAQGNPQEIADSILHRHGRGTDDALVLVARYVGAPS